ncbi:permease [Brochothrix campestris FSL F6-1037]|uniref:Permease n=1 Tax=Brochothrix campestris FSL F6-1037 TaxID=1265861 RepID=W7CXC0_9LIST|nr:permease [Brochothrix campestris FSL F6-1037]
MNTIFISILIEALPFVIIGTVISGIIQAFLSEKLIARMMPQRKFTGVLFGSALVCCFRRVNVGLFQLSIACIRRASPCILGLPLC